MARVTFSKHGINPVEKVNLESFLFAVFHWRDEAGRSDPDPWRSAVKRCSWCCRPTHTHSDPDLRKWCRLAHFLFLHLSLKKWFACHGQMVSLPPSILTMYFPSRTVTPEQNSPALNGRKVTKTGNWAEYISYHLAKGQNVSWAVSWIVVLTPEMCPCSHTPHTTNTMCTICAPPR